MPEKIDPALRERAVRLVREHRSEYPSTTAAVAAVARQEGVGHESLRRWMAQADIDAGDREGVTSEEAAEVRRLKAENKRCARTSPYSRRLRLSSWGNPATADHGIHRSARAEGHAVESIIRVLREQGVQVAVRTYRAWRKGRVAARTLTDALVLDAIRDVVWISVTMPDGTQRRTMTPEGLGSVKAWKQQRHRRVGGRRLRVG